MTTFLVLLVAVLTIGLCHQVKVSVSRLYVVGIGIILMVALLMLPSFVDAQAIQTNDFTLPEDMCYLDGVPQVFGLSDEYHSNNSTYSLAYLATNGDLVSVDYVTGIFGDEHTYEQFRLSGRDLICDGEEPQSSGKLWSKDVLPIVPALTEFYPAPPYPAVGFATMVVVVIGAIAVIVFVGYVLFLFERGTDNMAKGDFGKKVVGYDVFVVRENEAKIKILSRYSREISELHAYLQNLEDSMLKGRLTHRLIWHTHDIESGSSWASSILGDTNRYEIRPVYQEKSNVRSVKYEKWSDRY